MSGFVYIWINKVNLKWYIGSHKGTTTDGYTASGTVICRAFKKYGIENFERSILYEGPNYRQEEENLLITLDASDSKNSYNLKNAAIGGNTNNSETAKRISIATLGVKKSNTIKMGRYIRSDEWKEAARIRNIGKTVSTETGKKISQSLTGRTRFFSEEHKQNLKTPKTKIICQHCGKEGGSNNMHRYHFNNCNIIKKGWIAL